MLRSKQPRARSLVHRELTEKFDQLRDATSPTIRLALLRQIRLLLEELDLDSTAEV